MYVSHSVQTRRVIKGILHYEKCIVAIREASSKFAYYSCIASERHSAHMVHPMFKGEKRRKKEEETNRNENGCLPGRDSG